MTYALIFLILASVLLNTGAQLALKIGMTNIGPFSFKLAPLTAVFFKILISPWIIAGVAAYIFSMLIWLLVLSRTQVSIAYPMASLGYIVSAIGAHYLLGEQLNLVRLCGILAILCGVMLVAKS